MYSVKVSAFRGKLIFFLLFAFFSLRRTSFSPVSTIKVDILSFPLYLARPRHWSQLFNKVCRYHFYNHDYYCSY